MKSETKGSRLWTYDFTVITVGSLISMVGGNLAGFAIGILVLDYTGSTFLYVLFNVCYQLPMLVSPILAGPYLDRMSRKKVIYRLDFLSSVIFLGTFLLLRTGWFNYPLMLLVCTAVGAINGVYRVAYDSFYPNLISKGNYRKAYSVSSMLWPLAMVMNPVAATIYEMTGSVTPVFAINCCCFFVAACFERTIRHRETHMDDLPPKSETGPVAQFSQDLREGMTYIRGEKGLLCIAFFFMINNACWGAESLHLPFFRNNAHLFAHLPIAAVTLFTIVSNCGVVGRFVGGVFQYRTKLPANKKYQIAITIYTVVAVLAGTTLFMPVPLMMLSFFLQGILGITSFTIRTSATQAYVPDSIRARFNGVFQMMMSTGNMLGTLLSGALAEVYPERAVLMGVNLISLMAIYFFIYRGRKYVAAVYNRDL